MTTVVRSAETFEAVHITDDDFKEVLGRWMTEAGIPATEIGENIAQLQEAVETLDHKPWLVNQGHGLAFVHPADFLNTFEDVAETDTLAEVYQERTRHIALGYTPEHDDAQPSSHLPDQIGSHLDHLVADDDLTDAERRKELIQIASLAVAAVDKIDRAQNARTFSAD